jgi:L-threonylcarbamoyladenylate synthase
MERGHLALHGLALQPVEMPRPLPDILPIRWPDGDPLPAAATEQALDRAAAILADGGLVAIPTETVYGLAARADDPLAVGRIFTAKRRPEGNPLIVHVAEIAMARRLSGHWPEAAERLASHFWPGPLTVVVPRGPGIPDEVTAGGQTVALRCPDQRLTRRLIEKAGGPLAAPSANRSLGVSPTTAAHVLEGLGNKVDLILDGGPCGRGIESTVVDCSSSPARILRHGPIGAEEIEEILGRPVEDGTGAAVSPAGAGPARSPGMLARHYAPRTPLLLSDSAVALVESLLRAGGRVGWMTLTADSADVRRLAASRDLVVVPMPTEPSAFAASLYATFHALDRRDLGTIVADAPPGTPAWRAIRDRLGRAAMPQERGSPAGHPPSPDTGN